MSGTNKSYLPSQRMMPVYTTISPPQTERSAPPEFPYDPLPSKALSSKASPYGLSPPDPYKPSQAKTYGGHPGESPKSSASTSYSRVQEFPYDPPDKSKPPEFPYDSMTNGGKAGTTPVVYSRGEDKSSPPSLTLAYPRMQDFPYGLSGVAMPSYNYSSELYSYVSNGFPRKSRMCSYCGKVFTRSTTRRYHEKRCPLLRAAGSLLKTEGQGTAAAAAAAALAAVKTESSPLGTSYSSTNTSYTPVSSSPHTSFSLASLSSQPYTSTSTTAVDQNRNAVSGIKGEPRELSDPSPSNSDSFNQGEVGTSRYTPDYDSSNHQAVMFSPPRKDHTSDSPLQMDNRTASGNTDQHESMGTNVNHSNLGSSNADNYYSPAVYQQYKDRNLTQQSSHISGNATSSYNDTLSQGTSGDGSSIGHQDQSQEDETMSESKSGTTQKSVLANKCSICGKTFDSPRQLHIHEQLHSKYKPYACRFCGQRFLKVSMRIAHERLHIGEKPYVCAICGLTFTRKYSVRLHMRRRHTDGPCLCRYCGKTLYTLQTLKTHLLAHGLPKSEKESLHYLGVSGGDRSAVPVATVGEESESGETASLPQATQDDHVTQVNKDIALAMEMELAGNSKEQEWCKICEKEFPKSFMRYHERLHADQKPYECPTCKKRFGYKNNMKSHMKLHAGIKPYQCHVCGAKFTRGSTLRRHARRHGIFTESVWDFFVQKGANSGEAKNASKDQGKAPAALAPAQVQGQGSPEISSTRSTQADSATAAPTPDSSHNYELGAYAGQQLSANSMYPAYAEVPTLPESIYHTYPSTSHFNMNYSNFTASQEPQADALNLSVQRPSFGKSLLESAATATADLGDLSEEDGESESKSNISCSTLTSGGANVGVQVNLCGCSDKTTSSSSLLTSLPFDHRLLSPLNLDGSGTTATSPSLSSGGDNFNQETVSTLMSSGRLFRCPHCDCYFSEYAMYRIHQKLHAKDANRPFLCPVCFEDCHDKMYYALHLYEHLRM